MIPSGGTTQACRTCVPQDERYERRDPMTFEAYLPWFLTDVPNEICNKGWAEKSFLALRHVHPRFVMKVRIFVIVETYLDFPESSSDLSLFSNFTPKNNK